MAWDHDGLRVVIISEDVTITGAWIVIPGRHLGDRERLILVSDMKKLLAGEIEQADVYRELKPGVPAPG